MYSCGLWLRCVLTSTLHVLAHKDTFRALATAQTQRETHPQPQDVVLPVSDDFLKVCAASVQCNRTFIGHQGDGHGEGETRSTCSYWRYFCHGSNAITTEKRWNGNTNKPPLMIGWHDEVGRTMQSAAAVLLELCSALLVDGVHQQELQCIQPMKRRGELWNPKLSCVFLYFE